MDPEGISAANLKHSPQEKCWDGRVETVTFLAVCILQVIPIFFFTYFPNSDGPAHAATGAVLNTYSRPEGEEYRRYLMFREFPPPNVFGHLILAGLLRIVSPPVADKILAAVLMVAFPWSVRRALGAWSPQFRLFSYIAIPFGSGWLVHMGFQNFLLSIILLFLTLSFWLRRRESLGAGGAAALAGLMLLLHFSHVVGLILLLLTLASVIVFGTLRNSRKSMAPDREFLRELWRRGAWTAAAAAPAAALTIHYLLTNSGSAMGDRLSWRTLVVFLGTLSGPIACFSNRELLFSIPLAFLILGLSARALRMAFEHRAGDVDWTFLALAVAATALYLAAPDSSSGGSFLSRRLTLFPVLFLVFWVSQFPVGARAGRLIRVGLIACALGLTLIRIPSYAAFNRDLAEFLSPEAVLPQRATFIPLMLIRQSEGEGGTARSKHTWPLDSAADHLMSVKGRMDLAHYEGAMEGFYLKFRPEVDPSRYIGSYPAWAWLVPPECDFLSYSSRTPGRLDYILLWGRSAASEETLRSASARSIFSQLENGYRKIFTSAPRGLMEVYERRK